MITSPFHFLDSFKPEDVALFFGREKETIALYQKLSQNRLVLMYGLSGTGKTSIAQCGLAGKLSENNGFPIFVRRGSDYNINEKLVSAIKAASISSNNVEQLLHDHINKNSIEVIDHNKEAKLLSDALQSVANDHKKTIYLIFDQLEELFIFGNKQEKEEFVRNIHKIKESGIDCRILLVLQEKFLGEIHEFEHTIHDIMQHRIRITKVSREVAREIAEKYCTANKVNFNEDFINGIFSKLLPNQEQIELTDFQAILDKAYRTAFLYAASGTSVSSQSISSNINLDGTIIEKMGKSDDWIGSYIEEQMSNCNHYDEGLSILKVFAAISGTSKQADVDEIIDFTRTIGKDIPKNIIDTCLQHFIDARIIRDKEEQGKYEFRHNTLASRISEKINQMEVTLIKEFEFIENAFIRYETEHIWLSEQDLKNIAPYEDKLILPVKFRNFINQSKWELHKNKHHTKRLIIFSAITLFVFFSVFSVWALTERFKAIKQKEIAEQQRGIAIEQKQLAEKMRQEAEKHEADAILSKNQAVEEKNKAENARKYAEYQRQLAQKNAVFAEQQRLLAVQHMEEANRQKKIAEQHEQQAFREKQRADEQLVISNQRLAHLFSEKAKNAVHEKNYNAANLYGMYCSMADSSKRFPVYQDFALINEVQSEFTTNKVYSAEDNDVILLKVKDNKAVLESVNNKQTLFEFADVVPIKDVVASEQNQVISFCNQNDSITSWDINTKQTTIDVNVGGRKDQVYNNVKQLIGNPSKNRILYYNNQGSIISIDQNEVKGNVEIENNLLFKEGVTKFVITDNGEYLYAFDDFTIARYANEKVDVLIKHTDTIKDIKQFDKTIFSVANDKTLRKWKETNGSFEPTDSATFENKPSKIYKAKNKPILALSCENGIIEVFQSSNLKKVLQLKVSDDKKIEDIAFTNQDKHLMVILSGGIIQTWDLSNLYQNSDYSIKTTTPNPDIITEIKNQEKKYRFKIQNIEIKSGF